MNGFLMRKGRLGVAMAAAVLVVALMFGTNAVASKKTIVFADLGWDSAQVHNNRRIHY
jgi:ABC-type proline/glycine betaine transport system substrate-binding protein